MARSPEEIRYAYRLRATHQAWLMAGRELYDIHVCYIDDGQLTWAFRMRSHHRVEAHLERNHDHEMAQIRRLIDGKNT